MYKISEQQINPKVLSVANSCHYDENSKNGKTRLYANTRQELPQQIPALWAKARMQKPQGGGTVIVQIPWSVWGEMVMAKTET